MRVCGQRLAPSSASILVSPCMLIAVTAGSLAHRYGSQVQQPEPPGPAAARGIDLVNEFVPPFFVASRLTLGLTPQAPASR